MRRFPSMKVGLASFLSCLALLLGLYTTTGTASAHTASHPFINVVSNLHRFGNCLSFLLEGGGFTPGHHVDLFASASGGASIDPDRVRANGNGRFLVDATACANRQFENCGNFIVSPTFFCGFNLNQQDFCGFDGFPGGQCFFGSAMKPVTCPPWNPSCGQSSQGPSPCPPVPGSPCFVSPQGPQSPQFPQGPRGPQGPQGSQGSESPQGSQSPQDFTPHGERTGCGQNQLECCRSNPNLPECQNNERGNFCERNPEQCNQGNGNDRCRFNNLLPGCFPGNGNDRCRFNNLLPECFPFHPRFRFHPVPVFDFCRFHFHERFPFCFRFFPQEFPIQIGILAVDEFTGRRAHAFVSFGF